LKLEKVFEYNNKLMGNDPSTAHIKAATIGACKDWAGAASATNVWLMPFNAESRDSVTKPNKS
jgi:hypothetical protein